jgi:integrase
MPPDTSSWVLHDIRRTVASGMLKAVWQAAEALDQPYGAFVRLLILTGARRSEIAEMTWRELDLGAQLWTLPAARAKNNREHTVPLPDLVAEILRALPRIDDSDLVLTLTGRVPVSTRLSRGRLDSGERIGDY